MLLRLLASVTVG